MSEVKTYKICHQYDIGDQSVYIESSENPGEAVAYLRFMAEELSGDNSVELSNLGMANALVILYGCTPGKRVKDAIEIDMHTEREARSGDWYRKNGAFPSEHLKRADEQILAVLEPHFGLD